MKTPTTCLFLLVAACGSLIASPSPGRSADTATARMYRVTQVNPSASSEIIKPGTSRTLVRCSLGSPNQVLTPHLWLYRQMGPSARDAAKAQDATGGLLIGFTGERVSSLYAVNDAARKVIIARTKNHPKVPNEVALATVPELPRGAAVAKD